MAVLVTLITAPVGAFGISLAGPRLLARRDDQTLDVDAEVAESQSNTVSHCHKQPEIHNSQSTPSFDSGIIMKPSKIETIHKTEGKLNRAFEDERIVSVL